MEDKKTFRIAGTTPEQLEKIKNSMEMPTVTVIVFKDGRREVRKTSHKIEGEIQITII